MDFQEPLVQTIGVANNVANVADTEKNQTVYTLFACANMLTLLNSLHQHAIVANQNRTMGYWF